MVGVAAEGGVIHISTGAHYILPRYLLFGVIAPTGRGRGNGVPGLPGYKVPVGVGWRGESKEIGGSPEAALASMVPIPPVYTEAV